MKHGFHVRRLAGILAPVFVALGLVTTNALAAPPMTPYGTVSAINGFSLSKLPATQWDRQLTAIASAGVQLVRSDADWGTIEPQRPGSPGFAWQFASTDAWVAALARHHLTWQPILDYDNDWSTAVADVSDFAAFGRAVVARYGVGGSFWTQNRTLPSEPVRITEVWNEENGQPWYVSPKDYGPLYAATRAAIHQVASQISVDVGGLSDNSGDFSPALDYPSWYVLRMFAYDPALAGHVDGFALHPYGTTATDTAEWLAEFRAVLTRLGEGATPIDVTEFGWVAGTTAAAENWRAAQMNALGLVFGHSNCGLRELAPYDWVNPAALAEPGDFGFVDRSAQSVTLRPAATSWFGALARAGGMTPFALCASSQQPPSTAIAHSATHVMQRARKAVLARRSRHGRRRATA